MSFLKPKAAKSVSENVNNDMITSAYGGQMQTGTGANDFIAQLLGISPQGLQQGANAVGGAADGVAAAGGAQQGFQNYLQQAGFAPAMRQMTQGTVGQGAAAGMLNSGSTARALQSRGAEINQGFFNNYLQQLGGVADRGMQAGGLIANTGQRSTSTGGRPSTLGSVASAVGGAAALFSDRRMKHDIEKVGEYPDGLGIYRFSYHGSDARHEGVMADEVAAIRPHALGPVIAGFATVNYGAL